MGIEKKTVLVLGAGRGQVGLINAAHALGHRAVVVSIPGDYPGFRIADETVEADLKDAETVANIAKELSVDGVVAAGADLALPALGMACELNGLPGLNISSSKLSSDKSLMKEAFVANGVNTARHITARKQEDALEALKQLRLPLIVKPVDLGGSRGINIVFEAKDMADAYRNTMESTSVDYCVIEEYIEGYEVSATALVAGGEILFVLPTGDVRYGENDEFPVGHYVPLDCEQDVLDKMDEQVRKAIKALRLDNCAVNADLIIREGEVYVLELTGRLGSNAMPELTSHYYGEDIHKFIVEIALGNIDYARRFNFSPATDKMWYAQMLLSEKSGVLKKGSVDDDCEILFFIKEGQKVSPFRNLRDCIGQVVVSGDTKKDCEMQVDHILKSLIVT